MLVSFRFSLAHIASSRSAKNSWKRSRTCWNSGMNAVDLGRVFATEDTIGYANSPACCNRNKLGCSWEAFWTEHCKNRSLSHGCEMNLTKLENIRMPKKNCHRNYFHPVFLGSQAQSVRKFWPNRPTRSKSSCCASRWFLAPLNRRELPVRRRKKRLIEFRWIIFNRILYLRNDRTVILRLILISLKITVWPIHLWTELLTRDVSKYTSL